MSTAHKLLLENKFSESNFVQFNNAAIAACSFGASEIQFAKTLEQKVIDANIGLCYIRLAMEVGLFFMPFFRKLSLLLKKTAGNGQKAKKHKEF